MQSINGWCSPEKAVLMMDLIKTKQLKRCLEIGVFGGKSLFPIAKALKYNKKGVVYAVDSWDSSLALQGMNLNSPEYGWWALIDFNDLHEQTLNLLARHKLKGYCKILKKPAEEVLQLFKEASFDFIHLDASHMEDIAFGHVTTYFEKLKTGGYFLLTDPNWHSMKLSLVFLLERAEILSPFTPTADFLLFQKSKERQENAKKL